jgi:hypothetical protein
MKSKPNKRKRGGQPGNLNGAIRPWRSFWKRRALKQEDRWIAPFIEKYSDELVSDKGGSQSITAREKRMNRDSQHGPRLHHADTTAGEPVGFLDYCRGQLASGAGGQRTAQISERREAGH